MSESESDALPLGDAPRKQVNTKGIGYFCQDSHDKIITIYHKNMLYSYQDESR